MILEQHKFKDRVTPRYPLSGIKKSLEKVIITTGLLLTIGGFVYSIYEYDAARPIDYRHQSYIKSKEEHVSNVTRSGAGMVIGMAGLVSLIIIDYSKTRRGV